MRIIFLQVIDKGRVVDKVIIVASLASFSVFLYLIWFNRWNIPAHVGLAFSIVAYVIPGLLTDYIDNYNEQLVSLYAAILLVGTLFFLVGIILGKFTPYPTLNRPILLTHGKFSEFFLNRVSRRSKTITILAIIGLFLSFYVMGFIPAFAEDKLSAKFFRGNYKAAYEKVAVLYRSCHFALSLLIVILLALWSDTKRRFYLMLALAASAALALSLTRSPAVAGILTWLGLFMARKRISPAAYIFLMTISYAIGGISFFVFSGVEFGKTDLNGLWIAIARGTSDIIDQLNFLQAFLVQEKFTFGRTIYGGLIPGNYQWNPSVWTLTVLNDTNDISAVASGGLRLPPPLWGYVNFGWAGVASFCLIHGIISGWGIKFLKKHLTGGTLTHSAVIMSFYMTFWGFFINFFRMSFYQVLQIGILLIIAGAMSFRLRTP
ncbi:hypothetical protein [[Pseudomonas] boreopolis]|uniref:hypothetical protein n=1 Tax=Xanthomonas boreopolis TaxID=86183 RepID=UPI003D9AB749